MRQSCIAFDRHKVLIRTLACTADDQQSFAVSFIMHLKIEVMHFVHVVVSAELLRLMNLIDLNSYKSIAK
jgi:hypothetical protein